MGDLAISTPDPVVGLKVTRLSFDLLGHEIIVKLNNELQSGAIDTSAQTIVRFTDENDEYENLLAELTHPDALTSILRRIVESGKIQGVSLAAPSSAPLAEPA